ncbi:MAG TPA: thiosulfate oxidation carrier complex protein SoxZ [Usitatibacter sp.]|nr:thiosulfate oxidation carrier complex protein SoxZ [Usitatibacter sp.]
MILGKIQVAPAVKRGDAFEVKVLIQHPMETGFRRDLDGHAIALNIVDKLWCTYGGSEVFRAELGSGVSANPYVTFFVLAGESGELAVSWTDDRGQQGRATATVSVA